MKEQSQLIFEFLPTPINDWCKTFEDLIISASPDHPTDQNKNLEGKKLVNGLLKTDNKVLN
jgi:hypothetical protein